MGAKRGRTRTGPEQDQNRTTLTGPALAQEVARLAALGRSQRVIAAELGVSRSTVVRHLREPATAAAVERVATEVTARVEADTVEALASARAASLARLVELLPLADQALREVLADSDGDPVARLRAVALVHDRVLGRVPNPDKAPAVTVTVHASAREVEALLDTRGIDELREAAYASPTPEG